MPVEVKWYGDEILKAIEEGLPDALFEAAQELGEEAKAKAPRHDGDLQESMYVATESKSTYKKRKVHRKEVKAPKGGAVVGFAAFYARYVEYGTKKHRARSFLRSTIDAMQNRMSEKIAIELGKKLK